MKSIFQRLRHKERSVSSTSEKENDEPRQTLATPGVASVKAPKPARRFSRQDSGGTNKDKDDPPPQQQQQKQRPKSGGFAEMWSGTLSRAQGKEISSSKLGEDLSRTQTVGSTDSQITPPGMLEGTITSSSTSISGSARPTTPFSLSGPLHLDPEVSNEYEHNGSTLSPAEPDDYAQMLRTTATATENEDPTMTMTATTHPIKRVAFVSPVRTPATSVALDSIAWDNVDPVKDSSSSPSTSTPQNQIQGQGQGQRQEEKAESSRNTMGRAKNVFRSKDKLRADSHLTGPQKGAGEGHGNDVPTNIGIGIGSNSRIRITKKDSAPPTLINPLASTASKPRFTSRLSHRRAETADGGLPTPPPNSGSSMTPPPTSTSSYQHQLQSPTNTSTSTSASSVHSARVRARTAPGVETGGLDHARFCQVRQSWSEITEEDLVQNLSPRERTRQEVLWEIVSSEDRYVTELCRLKTTFIDSLLPPSTDEPPVIPSFSSPMGSPRSDSVPSLHSYMTNTNNLHRSKSPSYSSTNSPPSIDEECENLPIAARFASPTMMHHANLGSGRDLSGSVSSRQRERGGSMDTTNTAISDQTRSDATGLERSELNDETIRVKPNGKYSVLVNGRPSDQEPVGSTKNGRSHHSLPPPPRGKTNGLSNMLNQSFSAKHSRFSLRPAAKPEDPESRPTTADSSTKHNKLHKQRQRMTSGSSGMDNFKDHEHPPELPEDLGVILDVLGNGVLDGHLNLADQLRKRYDDQYPLVRSLTDIFIANASVLNQYAIYVLHLEKALQQVESAVLAAEAASKKSDKGLVPEEVRLGRYLLSLEELAQDRGESGLVISLSKPFQRLLKYPLLFQNLLFHTDATSHEFDGTMLILEQVDSIVRRIEDEKSSQEQREKTRDAIARVEGLENDKLLAVPKPSRVYVEEHRYNPPATIPASPSRGSVRRRSREDSGQRRSFKRLSDLMRHEEKESWVVVFSDVSLLVQKTGTTTLPVGHQSTKHDGDGKGRQATIGRRSRQITPRNLYKFVKVLEWHVSSGAIFSNGMTDMQDISHSRSASFGLSPTTSRNEHNNNSTHVSIQEDEDENEHDHNNDISNYNNETHEHNTRNHDTNNQDENDDDDDDHDRDQSDSDDSEGAMSLIFANTPRPARPTSMDGAVGTTGRRPRREGRFSMGPAPRARDDHDDRDDDRDGDDLVDTTMRPTPGRAAAVGVGSPGTSPNKRAVRKTGSGMRGATVTHERLTSPNGNGSTKGSTSTSTARPVSRLSTSTRSRVGSTTETHASSARPMGTGRGTNRPTNLSMSMSTDRQQAKFAGRLRFPQGHAHGQGHGNGNGNGSEGRDSPISPTTPNSTTPGSARPITKTAAKTTTTMTNNNTKAPSARPGGQAGVGRKERLEKGKALVLPKAPGGRI